jgi:hypothetical protein
MTYNPGSGLNPQVGIGTSLILSGPFQYTWDTFADLDATPDVSGGSHFKTANTGATTITDFDNPNASGQQIVVLIEDANTTIQDLSNGSNIRLQGGIDHGPGAAYDMFTFDYDGTNWVERNRGTMK